MEYKRHIQDFTSDSEVAHHWGYADRLLPCTADEGSCAYLDESYGAHDLGMIYVGVFWLTLVAIFTVWWLGRKFGPKATGEQTGLVRLSRAIASTSREYLLADCIRPIFGRTTRLQVMIFGILLGYLAIWSFIGISYTIWITPVADRPGLYNVRSSLGPWADRVGLLAFGLTPLSILLASRESLLSVITGVPYQHFNFLHRWLGYVILLQSMLHTLGWCIINMHLYQPQPEVAAKWIAQKYMIWGCIAMALLLVLFILTLPCVIRRTGYEFFRKSHYVLAMLYIGACIGHWEKLHCFLTPSILFWGIDRAARLVRTYMIHRKGIGGNGGFFNPAVAAVSLFPDPDGDIVRLDFAHPHKPWNVGQHFFMCFSEGSIWQSHPFTPLNRPELASDGTTFHSYVFRAKGGETRKIANMLAEKRQTTTPVILTGPYGEDIVKDIGPKNNVLCIAGGTGVTYVLPVILDMARQPGNNRKVELVWFVRRRSDIAWIKPELEDLEALDMAIDLKIRILVTRDSFDGEDSRLSTPCSGTSGESSFIDEEKKGTFTMQSNLISVRSSSNSASVPNGRHLSVQPILEGFLENTLEGPTTVYASGPGRMMSDLRRAIGECNSGSKVWRGQSRYDVSLVCDERLEF